LFRHTSSVWTPPVVTVSGLKEAGMDKIWQIVSDHHQKLTASGELADKRRGQQQRWFWSMLNDGLQEHFLARADVKRVLPEIRSAVAEERLTPTEAARRLLALLDAVPAAHKSRGKS
jgi:LAO/AO transport system kinase